MRKSLYITAKRTSVTDTLPPPLQIVKEEQDEKEELEQDEQTRQRNKEVKAPKNYEKIKMTLKLTEVHQMAGDLLLNRF